MSLRRTLETDPATVAAIDKYFSAIQAMSEQGENPQTESDYEAALVEMCAAISAAAIPTVFAPVIAEDFMCHASVLDSERMKRVISHNCNACNCEARSNQDEQAKVTSDSEKDESRSEVEDRSDSERDESGSEPSEHDVDFEIHDDLCHYARVARLSLAKFRETVRRATRPPTAEQLQDLIRCAKKLTSKDLPCLAQAIDEQADLGESFQRYLLAFDRR